MYGKYRKEVLKSSFEIQIKFIKKDICKNLL